ncbi:MAG: NAD-dependent epimerase/dehydratase family protein [Planctomycetes bacterium]|nr:NAD-dependent epimerase/dehydratase family protein [Planctomycetota bacterium]
MRVLVTGGAGFIGSHLSEALLARGDEVLCLDDLSTGREANLELCRAQTGFEFVRGSVLDEALVARCVKRVEGVFHLAARVGVRLVLEQPSATLETNVLGTRHVLAAAARAGARVLFASSSEVYGRNEHPPFAEDDPLLLGATNEPRWSYASSKALGEGLAFAHAREQGLPVVVVRFFNVVGPRQRGSYGMVVPRFVRAALAGEPLEVYGDGAQTRCFLHVADAVAAVLSLWDEPRARGQVVNVGSARELSIQALAECVRAAAASRAPIVHMPYREAYGMAMEDFRRRAPELTRLTGLIGARTIRDLESIVAELVSAGAAQPTSGAQRP